MRRLLVLLVLGASVGAALANPSGYPKLSPSGVTDLAHLLTPSQAQRIEARLRAVRARSQVEIAVVTISDMRAYPNTLHYSFDTFARGFFQSVESGAFWKYGVLLVVSRGNHEARIELGAAYRARHGKDAREITQRVLEPALGAGRYGSAITDGVQAIAKTFAPVHWSFPWRVVSWCAGALAVLLIALSLIFSGKRGWGWVCVGLTLVLSWSFVSSMLSATLTVVGFMSQHSPEVRGGGPLGTHADWGGWLFGGGSSGRW